MSNNEQIQNNKIAKNINKVNMKSLELPLSECLPMDLLIYSSTEMQVTTTTYQKNTLKLTFP